MLRSLGKLAHRPGDQALQGGRPADHSWIIGALDRIEYGFGASKVVATARSPC